MILLFLRTRPTRELATSAHFFAIPPRELLLDREGWHNRPFAVHKGLDSCSMLQHCCVSSAPSPKRNLSQLPRSWNVWTRLAVVSQKQQGPTRHSREDCDGRVDAFVNTTAIGWCSFAVRWCDLAPARKRAPPGSSEVIIPQQRKLIGSSAQSGSAVHWCRRRVRFNKVSRRFRRLRWRFGRLWCRARSGSTGFRRRFRTKKIREALVQSQVRFNRVPEKVLSQVRFNRVWGEVPEKGRSGRLLAQSQFRRRFRRRSGRLWCRARSGSTRFRRRFRWRSGRLWCRARSGSTGFRRRPWIWCRARSGSTGFREGSGEGLGGFGAEPGQVHQGFGEGSGEGSGGLWCRAKSGSTVF